MARLFNINDEIYLLGRVPKENFLLFNIKNGSRWNNSLIPGYFSDIQIIDKIARESKNSYLVNEYNIKALGNRSLKVTAYED